MHSSIGPPNVVEIMSPQRTEDATVDPAASTTTTTVDVESGGVSSIENAPAEAAKASSSAWQVPVVELTLQNVTYSPLTSSAGGGGSASAASSSSNGGKRSFLPRSQTGNKATKTRTTVLHQINTSVEPYKLTAWMGPSGSGKTSLLSVAADLVSNGDLSKDGTILVNGEEGRIPKRLVGVVWQDDLLLSNLTVEENIYFCARLKTPESTPDEQVQQLVVDTMQELGLLHIRHSLVGNPALATQGAGRGVSGGERKRVSVASELVLKPSLLLLDEPTSGLDATTAQALVSSLKDLADKGHSVAVVIHQPRTTIYNLFDHLLLLSKGRVVFNGEPGKARAFLESCPTVPRLPPETGIADWMMDVITQDERREGGGVLAAHWLECQNSGACRCDMLQPDATKVGTSTTESRLLRRRSTLSELQAAPKFFVGFRMQLQLLTRRILKQQRGERLTATATLLQFAYLFFTALFWWRMPDNTAWVFNHNSLLFFMLIAQANGIVIAAVTVFQRERALLRRERAKKMYGVSSFFIAKSVSDLTTNVLLPLLYGMIVYWTANFRPTFVNYLQFIVAFYLCLSTAQSMGLFLSIAIPSTQISLILAPPITLFFMILGGFYIPFQNMNPGIYWLSWLSFARYGYSALIINEYAGRTVPCSPNAADNAVSIGSNASEDCPLPGEAVISGLGIDGIASNLWFNIGMMVVLQIAFRVGAYVLLRRSKH